MQREYEPFTLGDGFSHGSVCKSLQLRGVAIHARRVNEKVPYPRPNMPKGTSVIGAPT